MIDAVAHAFDPRPQNAVGGNRYALRFLEQLYDMQVAFNPPGYQLSRERFLQPMTAEALASVLFVESPTDFAVYHAVPLWGVFNSLSPIEIGLEARRLYPGRVFLYGAVSPLEGRKAIEDLERQVEEWGILGVKLYPVDMVDGRLRSYSLGDEQLVYPLLERCRELGVTMVAMHKAIPNGEIEIDPFRPDDVDHAARDFPDLRFEIVHGGFAFLEETALQIARFQNVYINLEATAQFLFKQPRRFCEILGELLFWGGAERIFWGTGAAFFHPAPVLEAFERLQMPADLVEGRGYPELTDELKAGILARNYAAAHGLDLDAMAAAVAGDALAQRRAAGPVAPWAELPEPAPAPA